MSRPLQNRVDPCGTLHAVPARGGWMGNRGGRIHNAQQEICRHHASKRWICCVLEFKGRQRQVMGASYTELFFLDEATALAAGHRPCFECRRADAKAFAAACGIPRADDMDAVLHPERMSPKPKIAATDLPDGAMVLFETASHLVATGRLHRWGWTGYGAATPLPTAPVKVLTPGLALKALRNGYTAQTAL